MADILIKRVYEPPAKIDGKRVLVDRLWPRGLRKADAALDDWWKELAPSPTLRTWFGHKPERFNEFKRRYKAELKTNPQLRATAEALGPGKVTLLFAAKDPQINHAVVLAEALRRRRA
jgi:uncharacterized protein YeaO (DUF488 family)